MGWWKVTEDGAVPGRGLAARPADAVWGDTAADVMGAAVEIIVRLFENDRYGMGRMPTKQELMAGLRFATNGLGESDWRDDRPVSQLVEIIQGWASTCASQPRP
jgi:hypothetical protein